MGLMSFLEKPGRELAELIESLKTNLTTRKSFELKTEEVTEKGRRILSIAGISLGDDGDPYNIEIEVPSDIYVGEIDSVLDWSKLSDKERTKFKISKISNKNYIFENSSEDYNRVLQFLNGINFSMDINDEIKPDTKIDKDFLYRKLYNDDDIPDVENEKQESLSRFVIEVDTKQDPDLIKNFYTKRKRILENKYNQLTQELAQEEEQIKGIAAKSKRLRNKILLSVILVVAAAIAAVAITAVVGGPLAAVVVFSSVANPVIYFLSKVAGFVKAFVASHPILTTIGFMGLFEVKKIRDGYKGKVRELHKEDIKKKQDLQKKIKDKQDILDKEEKSLESVLNLSNTKDDEEYDLCLDGTVAVRMACDYLYYHLQGYKGKNNKSYEYKASKLNIIITDPDDVVEFFKKFPNKENNINQLRLQNIKLCPSKIDIKIIQDMLQNNITVIDVQFIKPAANKLIKNLSNIISNLDIGNTINKELIINRYLQSATSDDELFVNFINKYGAKNLSNIFGVDIKADNQNFKQNLLLSIRNAAENKLIRQANLSDIKIRPDMKYICQLDKEFSEKVAFPMHLYYSPDGIKGSKNTGEFKQALAVLINMYSNFFKAGAVEHEHEHEREVLLKRLTHFISDLNFKEKLNKSTSNARRSIISFIAEKDIIRKLVGNGLDQYRLFLNNFFDCSNDNPKAQEIKSCFDKKVKFTFGVVCELVKDKHVSYDNLEAIVTDIFDNDKTVVDIFYKIKNERKNSIEIEALFEENANNDNLYEMEKDYQFFLKELRKSSKKDNSELVKFFMSQILPKPKSKPKLTDKDINKQNIFLNSFNKLNDKDKKDILKACIFEGKKAPSIKLDLLGNMLVEMLVAITQSSEIIAAIAKTDNGLYPIFSALNSNLKYDLKAMPEDNNFYIFIRDFFIDQPKILSKDPKATKAIEIIQSIFSKIDNDLSKQNSDLCREIQESFVELKRLLANTQSALSLDGSKLKQEDKK